MSLLFMYYIKFNKIKLYEKKKKNGTKVLKIEFCSTLDDI